MRTISQRALPLFIAILVVAPVFTITATAATPPVVAVNARTSATYGTIQAALDAALPGDTITVPMSADTPPTPYTEALVIGTDAITLCATVALGICAPEALPGRWELNGLAFADPPVPWQGQAMVAATGTGSTSHFPNAFFAAVPMQIEDIEAMSFDFLIESGGCGGGSPRMQIALDLDGDGDRDTQVYVSARNTTVCTPGAWHHVDLMTRPWALNGLGGPSSGTQAQAQALAGPAHRVHAFNLIVDSPPAGTVAWFDNKQVNGAFLRENADLACLDPQSPNCRSASARPATILDAQGAEQTILVTGWDATIQGFTIGNAATTDDISAIRTAAPGPQILDNDIMGNRLPDGPTQIPTPELRQFGVRIGGSGPSEFLVARNTIVGWSHTGVYGGGSGSGAIADNVILGSGANAIYLEDGLPVETIDILGNDLRANRNAAVRVLTSSVVTMRENLMGVSEKTVTFHADHNAGIHVDARYNHWGAFNRADIEATIEAPGDQTVDVSCYYLADGETTICPPTAAFTYAPSAPHHRQSVLFTDASTSGGNDIESRAWDFGDATTSTATSPAHAYQNSGVYTATLTVIDSEGFESSASRSIAVANQAPTLTAPANLLADEGSLLSFALTGADADGDALTYTMLSGPTGVAIQAASGAVSWTPTQAQVGTHTLAFRVSDRDMTADASVVVDVADVAQAPTITTMSATSILAGSTGQLLVRATDGDGDVVTLTATNLPAWAALVAGGPGHWNLTYAPPASATGSHVVTLTADDGALTSSRDVTITIVRVAGVSLTRVGSTLVTTSPGTPVNFTGTLRNTGGDVDTYTFAALAGAGWTITTPASVSLAPGESRSVDFTATSTTGARTSTIAITAKSGSDPAKTASVTWNGLVPIRVTVAMSQATYAMDDAILGVATVTYLDGAPAMGAQVTVSESPSRLNRLASQWSGTTGADGTFAFDATGGLLATLVGDHDVLATATRFTNVANHATTYAVSLV